MPLKTQTTIRQGFIALTVLLAAACSSTPVLPTATPIVITTTPIPRTPVPTFERLETATPTPLPTEPLIIRDALTGAADTLYVRPKPSTMAEIADTVAASTAFNFVGRTDDNRWLQVNYGADQSGWLLARSVTLPFAVDTLPITGTGENVDYVALVSAQAADGISLYASPHGEAEVVAQLPALTPLRLDGRREDGIWLHGLTADSKEGWFRRSLVDLNFDIGLLTVINVEGLDTGAEVVQARVLELAGGLRLRQLPSTDALRMGNLDAGKELVLEGRTADNTWVLVKMPEGYEGWTSTAFLEIYVDLSSVAVIDNPEPVPFVELPTPEGAPQVVASAGGGGARTIYVNGQAAGNQRNVFSKVGDSLTDTPNFLRAIVNGYNLRDYGYLLPTIQFFMGGTALGGNSFNSASISSRASWGTVSALDPGSADPGRCNPGETPVSCEMRVVKPAAVLVMIGTNDSPAYSADAFGERLRQIVETCIQYNVVPILSTLPPRAEFNDNIIAYNQVITGMANSYGVPLTDLYSAVINLPNHGYGDDGIHLSVPPGGVPATVDFTSDNLQYGSTMRNLTTLQILDSVLKNVMY